MTGRLNLWTLVEDYPGSWPRLVPTQPPEPGESQDVTLPDQPRGPLNFDRERAR